MQPGKLTVFGRDSTTTSVVQELAAHTRAQRDIGMRFREQTLLVGVRDCDKPSMEC